MKWFKPIELESSNVLLVPMTEQHKDALLLAARDGNLTELRFSSVPNPTNIDSYIAKAVADFNQDKGLAFVVIDKLSDSVVGATRFANAVPQHCRLEIGYTWYAKTYQKTHVNSECKLLLLSHAFETLKAIAVEFRTNWYNFASRKAIEKLGAKQDGLLRNHQIMPDDTLRDTVVFSIIESEWPACKAALEYRIERMLTQTN